MLEAYRQHVEERAQEGIPPKPLNAEQVAELVELLKAPPAGEEETVLDLLTNRVPPGVDEAAYVKAGFLTALAKGEAESPLIDKVHAVKLLGTMQGGYNIATLVELLDDAELAKEAGEQLKHTLLMFDAFHDVADRAKAGNEVAKDVMQSWADAEWFLSKPALADKITLTVFKVPGETNTDDLSPAPDAWSRPDIPLHANAMLKNERDGIEPEVPGTKGPMAQIEAVKAKGFPVAYVGDVVGTGSSRKSATNSVLWFFGDDIPNVPNKRAGGFCFGGKIAPIFFNTMEDAGALPVEMDVSKMEMGDVIDVYPYEGKVCRHDTDEVISTFELKTQVILDEVRAGGRIPLIIGRGLTDNARKTLGLEQSDVFRLPEQPKDTGKGFTLAQKMVGKACGLEGVRPGMYCEPKMTTVGSQDTTGPMTRDELKDLACLGFQADLVMQSFCHTSAYPKPVDVETHHTLPDFIMNRGGVSLRPGDGIIHSWLNRMLLPDTVGTGGDSHTRFPMGISFPAGSGLVAFAAATGVMPLDMPESILVRFKGKRQPGVTLRDLVHAIPYYAIQKGLLTVEKSGKKNAFSGRVLEIEGLEDLTVEQAFELSDASAERSAAGCTITLSEDSVSEYLKSNITLLKWMIANGYGDKRTIERRILAMEEWLADPSLMRADADAEYAEVIEIDLEQLKEPVLCAPNDPDDARLLSEVAGQSIDEVFIGSCMTNIGHFRAAGKLLEKQPAGSLKTKLWLAPPTKMDQHQLTEEGYYGIYGRAGARMEMPGCSLCMGNQARVAAKSTVVSTSTRNFPNRLGDGADVFLASAELAAVAAVEGRLPSVDEYRRYMGEFDAMAGEIYRYMNFHEIEEYQKAASNVIPVAQEA
ncbi:MULTISPECIES: bifunctional aconitate hydratase 2/2-methylisocitrate dehydratase [unclassified Halomonas]|uniref:bifunctional aconitate hydratase 2/2-methylisocitrate dehydratase n=1 Tax=unclassified Halomonas TaxID=2609666 RepID=UPI0005F9EC4B|nr:MULTISPECIES: bifunctional aconitate hydratase 2/2-methylisocitrate dehydratase [unclassified Halomonas]KJZ05515.1 bifunctional aconitate hydratase 2/2-methylisocitrate dehydratase [Halomonas sp. S2151]MBR9879057.1 bifunctional aconitate hydratase 2/2-methylisocitrate dehydratase [Gammaproteobacteria bacterium]MBS8270724.1 bifunctional aconitate hydratase 2/2-methylisocitrate dehydratase [Halomonas litopenaei]MCO7215501.1 bifunctional aconitate hydratase 2/2-methylisocitrate dehydratase [Hal